LSKEFQENGFKAEGFYSDVAGTTFNPESTEIALVAKKFLKKQAQNKRI